MKGVEIIITRLQAVAGVTNLVGAAPNDRIYKGSAPEKPLYPLLVLKMAPGGKRMQGTYSNPGYVEQAVQLIALAKTMDEADELAEQARQGLERFGSAQPAGIPFAGTTLYDIVNAVPPADGYAEEVEAFFVTADYIVHHLEPTP